MDYLTSCHSCQTGSTKLDSVPYFPEKIGLRVPQFVSAETVGIGSGAALALIITTNINNDLKCNN